ncbi:GMP synthase [Vibrio sp. S4M6]|uniref:glutamine amidotransferase-related protein n=1 Tax=Vibrio sinus TaxID=2946865 RepID=UPI00202A0BFB|nr:GMP synthase [Vibrio sinus]MCL9783319.1 GMP synthase [Vibrio sinus]
MKIGVLLCDDVAPELREKHGQYSDMFESLFEIDSGKKNEFELVFYNAVDKHLPQSVCECEGYVISGSKFSVYDQDEWIVELSDFIRQVFDAEIKTIGICFGHQLIAQALGGKVVKSPKGWGAGVAINQVLEQPRWFYTNVQSSGQLSLIVSHQDQVVELPCNTKVLATNDFCPNSIILIDQHFLGIQGHPEFDKAFSEDLMNHRRDSIGESAFQKGMESLSLHVNRKEIKHTMVSFLNSSQ